MKFDKSKLDYIGEGEYLYRVLHDGSLFTFTTPVMTIPFGLDEEYGKTLCRIGFPEESRMTTQHQHIRKIIEKIEKYVSERFDVQGDELKTVFRKKDGFPDIIEGRMKEIKDRITTKVIYENKSDNYLKTVYEIPEKSSAVITFEWFGVFDYRNHPDTIQSGNKRHKVGIILFIKSILIKDPNRL